MEKFIGLRFHSIITGTKCGYTNSLDSDHSHSLESVLILTIFQIVCPDVRFLNQTYFKGTMHGSERQ